MLPRNVDPRLLKKAMKQLGIKSEDLDDVLEVIIKTSTKNYVFKNARVTMMEAQGEKTFQVVGEPEVVEHAEGEEVEGGLIIPKEDILLVAEQAGVSESEARKALEESNGEPAEAIIKLM
ncbi:MAG: nascent polypeptide-associated complex protein, partial [Thermoplasmata archaeon]|nr:nascent polypeptide-associated complex protein [Thermoplasmata archaeon]